MGILIKNGRLIDPKTEIDEILDILIEDNIVKRIGSDIDIKRVDKEIKVIEAEGKWVVPGFIDIHTHFREPGFEYKEDIESISKSAAKGGFTTIVGMPNTNPVVDNSETVRHIYNIAKEKAIINILQAGSMSRGLKGEELSDYQEMKSEGIIALSEDGKTLMNTKLFESALKVAIKLNLPILSHCEDSFLVGKGAMNEGKRSEELNIDGISNEVEDIITYRDLLLAKKTNAKLHLCHMSTKESVNLLRDMKKNYEFVSGEVSPHHFTLTEDDVYESNTNTKMNPPLRTEEDRLALIEGLKDGTIEVIATDHAPHSIDDKKLPFSEAPFGIVGLETALSIGITNLVNKEVLSPIDLIRKMTINPANIINLDKGYIKEGNIADITILDPNASYKIDVNKFESKSKNSPFDGYNVNGKVLFTIVNGRIVFEDK